MKRPRAVRITAVVVIVALVGAFLVLIFGVSDREPSYERKRLSAWLADLEYSPGAPPQKPEKAIVAVRQIGTNALPTLLRMMGAVKPRPRFLESVKLWLVTKLPGYHAVEEEPSPRRAMLGFWALGPVARPAVPSLLELLKHPRREVRQYSAAALGGIGPGAKEAIGPLLVMAQQGSYSEPFEATRAIACIGPDRPEFVPALVSLLGREDPDVRLHAAMAVGKMGAMASNAVPALRALLNYQHTFGGDGGAEVRAAAQRALDEIAAGVHSVDRFREGEIRVEEPRGSRP